MAPSPPKRRKLSPPENVADNAEADLPATQNRNGNNGGPYLTGTPTTPPSAPDDARARTPSRMSSPVRPSYASPTKASIARTAPQLLERPPIIGEGMLMDAPIGEPSLFVTRSTETTVAATQDAPGTETAMEVTTAQAEEHTTVDAQKTVYRGKGRPRKSDEGVPGRGRSKTPSTQAILRKTPVPDELPNPFKRGGLRRSPIGGSASAQPVRAQTPLGESESQPQPQPQPQHGPEVTRVVQPARQKTPVAQPEPQPQPQPVARPQVQVQTLAEVETEIEAEEQEQEDDQQGNRDPARLAARQARLRGLNAREADPALQFDFVLPAAPPVPPTPQVPADHHAAANFDNSIISAAGDLQTQTTQAGTQQPSPEEQAVDTIPEPEQSRRAPAPGTYPRPGARKRTTPLPEEPQLPPTPTQLGIADPIASTPPAGIHNTPRRKKRGAGQMSSPLKPRDAAPSKTQVAAAASLAAVAKSPPVKRRRDESAQRWVTEPDPPSIAEKKKERDRLLAEIRQAEEDLALAEKENARSRLAGVTGKDAPKPKQEETDTLLDMLARAVEAEKPKTPVKSVFQRITSFLPFSARPKKTQQPVAPKEDEEDEIVGVKPVKLENPLPFLQLFTPLTFSSIITVLPPTPSADDSDKGLADIVQSHAISASHPAGLFYALVNLTVNATTLSVTALDIESLDPSAEPELGAWVRSRASDKSVLGRDVNAVFFAMGQWVEEAITRAQFWCRVDEALGTREARAKIVQRVQRLSKRVYKRRKVDSDPTPEELEEEEARREEAEAGERKWKASELLPRMRRRSWVVDCGGAEVEVRWRIGFDWTGEVEREVECEVRVPRSWQENDERGSLDKIPATFKGLVKSHGPFAACKMLVAVLMPES